MTVWRVWCRFDIGQHRVGFVSKIDAEMWAKRQAREYGFSYTRMLEEEFVGFRCYTMKKETELC